MITFALVVLILCFGIWFMVSKSDRLIPERAAQHPVPASKDDAVKKDEEKPPPAAATEAVEWADRRLSERWRDWLALTTTIIAILTMGMSLQVSHYLTISLISQGKETNAWSYYQAKSMKEHNVIMSKVVLELQLAAMTGISAEAAEKYRATIKRYDEEIKRYKDERDEIQQQAEELSKNRDKANKSAGAMNNSLAFLQVAIVLSAIATMVRKKYIWYIGLATLTGWLYFFIRSF